MVLVNYIDLLSLGVSEMIFFAFFCKRPINLKKFNFNKTFFGIFFLYSFS